MSESMIERVAEGQAKFDGRTLMAMPCGERERYYDRARIAIGDMREPTEAMIDSCGNGECSKWAPGAWQNYIDAALNEQVSG